MDNQPTAPVMDVTAPPPKSPTKPDEIATAPTYDEPDNIETTATEDNIGDSQENKLPENAEKSPEVEKQLEVKEEIKPEKPKAVTQQKSSSPSSNVGLAIIATVVIVFGLAAIATYAYMQQNS